MTACDFQNATCFAKSTRSRQQEESLTINRRGTFYIVVDGSSSRQNGSFSLAVSCPQPPPTGPAPPPPPPGCGTNCDRDNFSNYTTSRRVAAQSRNWRTWNRGNEGTSQDARVRTAQNSREILHIVEDNDVVYDLGNKRTGVHCFSTRLWMSNSGSGYFNIQSNFNTNQSGGYWRIRFRNGRATMKHTNYTFNYRDNQWLEVSILFDLDNDEVIMICEQNGQVIGRKTLRYRGNIQLGGLNLFGERDANFYCDWVEVNCGGVPIIAGGNLRNGNGSRSRQETIEEVAVGKEAINDIKKTPFDRNRNANNKDNNSANKSSKVNIP